MTPADVIIDGRPAFDTREEAEEWRDSQFEPQDCMDSTRFAFEDDQEELDLYYKIRDGGCCGFFDQEIYVDYRTAMIGCNYGH